MSSLRLIAKNPLVLTLPIVLLLLFAWQHYTLAISSINIPTTNMLFNSGFDTLDNDGFPSGWLLTKGDESTTYAILDGYHSPNLLEIDKSAATGINTTLSSPGIDVASGHTYFYKGFYSSTVGFDLLMKSTRADGTSTLEIVGHYSPSTDWTTVSHAFRAGNQITNVQFVYSLTDKGKLQLDNNYAEQDPKDVYSTPERKSSTNIIQNASLDSDDDTTPNNWYAVMNGTSESNAWYSGGSGEKYLQTSLKNYKDGEAKWRYAPVDTAAGRSYRFGVTYRSDTPAEVVAEYQLASGERTYETLETLQPANDWTTIMPQLTEAPQNATTLFVTVVQHSNGFVDTKGYELEDVTKEGPTTWNHPSVSLSFDDGWNSTYENGVPLLNSYGFKSTFYIDPASIDTYGFMSSDHVEKLKKAGQEIASHGYEHIDFTTLPPAQIDYQMQRAFQYFSQVHGERTVDFAAPFGSSDAQLTYYVRKYYRSLRGTDDGINTRQNFDPYDLKALYIGSRTPVSKVVAALNDAKAKNGWVILIYHKVAPNEQGNDTTISPAQFEQQLTAIKKSGVSVAPVSAVMNDVTNK